VEFPLQWLHKDLQMVAQTAFELGITLPTGSAAQAVYGQAKNHGLGELDFSAIYQFLSGKGGK